MEIKKKRDPNGLRPGLISSHMIHDITIMVHSILIHLNHVTIQLEIDKMSVSNHVKSSKKEIRALKAKMEQSVAVTSTQAKQLQVQFEAHKNNRTKQSDRKPFAT